MRLLIHIPIVHSQADMGSSSKDVERAYIDQKGHQAWQESRRAIAEFWQNLEQVVLSLDIDFSRVRLYQDGLPVCGHEAEIVRDLAKAGGSNYRILLDLMARGAMLEGTECPELLLKEYELLKASMLKRKDADNEGLSQTSSLTAKELLEERDSFIARRIDETLQPGEIGMLFLGALHNAVDVLPPTIESIMLMLSQEDNVSKPSGRLE